MKIKIDKLNKSFSDRKIFNDFNLELSSENINCIIGESGGGKSTLLNLIAGLISKCSGEISGIKENEISYIFQEDRLIPWLTIGENLKISSKRYYDDKELDCKVREILELVHIKDVENRYPEKLSGGMRQRVNIARALLKPSKLILMDEPFKSLDYKVKYSIMTEIQEIFKRENRMVIFVTHDVDEAIHLNGTIYVLGGSPFEIRGVFKENLLGCRENIIKLI